MLFRNPWLLAGLAGVLIPVILHMIRRQAAKPYDWGAMRFLFDTIAARRRRMEWEDFLLHPVSQGLAVGGGARVTELFTEQRRRPGPAALSPWPTLGPVSGPGARMPSIVGAEPR